MTIPNGGAANLSVAIRRLPCSVALSGAPMPTTVPVPAHGSVPIVCSADVTCPTGLGIHVSVTGTAVASESIPCVYNVQHEVITTAASTCTASVNCVSPVTCRVTGGGDLYDGDVDQSCVPVTTTTFPRIGATGLTI